MRRGPAVFILICLLVASAYGAQRVMLDGAGRVTGFSPTHFKGTRPTAGPPALAQRLVLVVADGLRSDDAHMLPSLDWLAQKGAQLQLTVPDPGYPMPAAATLLTGARPETHGVLVPPGNLLADNLLAAARRAKLKTGGAGTAQLGKLVKSDIDSWADVTSLVDVMDQSQALLAAGGPRLVLIETDFVAQQAKKLRTANRDSADYRDALARLDYALVKIMDQVDWKTTAVAVVGLVPVDEKGHYAPEMPVPMVMAGPGIKPGYNGEAGLTDVAPTLAVVLGVPVPLANAGQAVVAELQVAAGRPTDVIAQREMESRKAYTDGVLQALGSMSVPADPPQTAAEQESYRQSLDKQISEARFAAWREWGLGILPYAGGALLLVLIYLIVVWRQPFGGALFLGTLVYAAAFHAIFFLTGGQYSGSMAGLDNPGRNLVLGLGARAAGAMVVAVAITGHLLARKGFKKRAYVAAAACHLALSSALVIALPVAGMLARTGWQFADSLPAPGLVVWFFVTGIQVLVLGYLSPLWVGLTVAAASISRRTWPLKEIGDPERNADKVVRVKALRRNLKR